MSMPFQALLGVVLALASSAPVGRRIPGIEQAPLAKGKRRKPKKEKVKS